MKKALPKNPDWSYQHHVADKYLRDFENAFVSSVQDLQDAAKVEVIEESLRRGRPEMLVNFVGVREHLEDPLSANWTPVMNNILTASGATALQRLDAKALFTIRNPYAEVWAQNRVGMLIREVSDETVQAVRGLIAEGMRMGHPPEVLARRMRKWIGLTQRQEMAVLHYWESVASEGLRRLKTADKMAETYAKRLLRHRARLIARTETINASAKGTQLSWQHARDYGYVAPDAVQEWIAATRSGRTCERCMAFDGIQTPIGGVFVSRDGETSEGPTLHPGCRCAVGLVTPTS